MPISISYGSNSPITKIPKKLAFKSALNIKKFCNFVNKESKKGLIDPQLRTEFKNIERHGIRFKKNPFINAITFFKTFKKLRDPEFFQKFITYA